MNNNQKHLELISALLHLCSLQEIDIWLMGGWGLDFLLNKETRVHDDIDFILENKNYLRISAAISNFADHIEMDSEEKIKFTKGGVRFDICFFFQIEDRYYLDLKKEDQYVYPMPKNSFQEKNGGMIFSIEAKAISWDAQYVAKKGYANCTNMPLRKKDRDDLDIIERYISYPKKELNSLLPGIKKNKLRLK